jgi:hypothetical protein
MNLFSSQEVLDSDSDELVEITNETVRWRARDATFLAGKWDAAIEAIPILSSRISRYPLTAPLTRISAQWSDCRCLVTDQRIPVGVVSNTYRLVQHADVVAMCIKGFERMTSTQASCNAKWV